MDDLTLVVVDLQEDFLEKTAEHLPKDFRRLMRAAKRTIARFVREGRPIVFVEYVNYGRIMPELTDLVVGYDKVAFVTKDNDDGSYAMFDEGIPIEGGHFLVCGVNRDYCVAATAYGLRCNFNAKTVEIVQSCTYEANDVDDCSAVEDAARAREFGFHPRFAYKKWADETEELDGVRIPVTDLRTMNKTYVRKVQND